MNLRQLSMCILFLIFACNAPNKEDPRALALKSFEKDGVPSLKYLALQFALDMNNNVGGICTVMHSPESSDFTTEYGAGFASCKLKEVKDSRDSMLFMINHTNCQTTGTAKEGLPPCLVALRTQYSCLLDRATALDIVIGRSTQAKIVCTTQRSSVHPCDIKQEADCLGSNWN